MIGELDRRIAIYRATSTQSSTGEPQRTWALYRTCWAFVEESGGNESIVANTPTVTADKFFTVRYKKGIKETMRIVYDEVNYNILHIEEIDRKRYMKITAVIPDNE